MLRKLLACLALLTGLAAAGAPAQADVAVAMASQMEASAAGDAVHQSQAQPAVAQPSRLAVFAEHETETGPGDRAVPAPAVRLGSDRARE